MGKAVVCLGLALLALPFLVDFLDYALPLPPPPSFDAALQQPGGGAASLDPPGLLAQERFVSPLACVEASRGWGGALSASEAAAPPGGPPPPVSLRPREPGEQPPRPVGFTRGAARTLVLEDITLAGVADRMAHIRYALLLARLLDANLTVPRPCAALAASHTGALPPCAAGWDLYMDTPRWFHGYDSGAAAAAAPPPACEGQRRSVWSLIDSHPDELPGSFCLSAAGVVYPHKTQLRAFAERLAGSVWGCGASARAAVDALELELTPGYSQAVLARAAALVQRRAPGGRRFGAVHIRRGDRAYYTDCTEPERVVGVVREAVRAAGPAADGLVWFVFSADGGLAEEVRERLVAAGLAAPGDVLTEAELPELRDPPPAPAEAGDNYFAMRVAHWVIQHAAVSVRTSDTNDWMWKGEGFGRQGEERAGRSGSGGDAAGGAEATAAAASGGSLGGADGGNDAVVGSQGSGGGQQQWVFYLCSKKRHF